MSSYGMYGHEFKIGMGISSCFNFNVLFIIHEGSSKFSFYGTCKTIVFSWPFSASVSDCVILHTGEAGLQ